MPPTRNVQRYTDRTQNKVSLTLPSRRPLVGNVKKHYHVLFAQSPGWGFWVNSKRALPEEQKSNLPLPEGVLKIKKGYNPNSSSIGTVIYQFPYVYIAVGVICAFLAALVKPDKDTTSEAPHSDISDTCTR